MLVNFTFQNYRSFKDEATLSMEAAPIQELSESVKVDCDEKLVPVAVLYGPNSSGKSNVLKALKAMRDALLNSVKLNPKDELETDPFCLDLTSVHQPTSFEIQFILGNSKYRYGFDYNNKAILAEWLYEKRKGEREFELFLRGENEFKISKIRFAEGLGKQSSTPGNRLFLSLVAQLNGKTSQSIIDWFSNMEYLSGLSIQGNAFTTYDMLYSKKKEREEIMSLFSQSALGFNEIEITRKIEISTPTPTYSSKIFHNIFDQEGKIVGTKSFSTDKMESEGTKKMIEIAGPIVEALYNGKILIVDELDAKLHPFLTRKIIGLFMSKETNKKGAQLIFATHDTNLLNLEYLRRDQIWFTEKSRTDSTELYSLVEFRDDSGSKVRNDRNIEKDYINGRYGAIPLLN